MENLNLVLPEIFISLSIMFLLVLGVFKKDSSKITFTTLPQVFSFKIVIRYFSQDLIRVPFNSQVQCMTVWDYW